MPRLIDTIICDDIRVEVGNKFSYMGIYQKDLFVSNVLPWTTSKLCFIQTFYIEMHEFKLSQKIVSPSSQIIAKLDFVEKGKVSNFALPFITRSIFGPIKIDEFGEYKLEVYINDQLTSELTYKFKFLPNN